MPGRWSPALSRALRLGDGGLGRGLLGHDADPLLVLGRVLELDLAGRRREHGVIPAEAGAGARQERHPALTDDDRAGRDELAVADLHAEALADRIAAVLRAGTSLLVGHEVYSSFFVAGFAFGLAVDFAAGFASDAPLWVLARGVFGSALAADAFVAGFEALAVEALAVGFASAFVDAFAGAFAFASFSASAASSAACLAATSSSRWRSVFAAASALRRSSAALRPPSFTSVIRRTVSSWRWPRFTRLRALGRYLNAMTFSPRPWRTSSASTAASATTGVPIVDSSPSATRSTRSIVRLSPGAPSSSSTSSSVPTSTRYCFPPVSMTAYMEPFGLA